MLQTLKLSTKTQNIFFTSDFHYNHDPRWPTPIWKMRGHNSVGESNEFIIKAVNDTVGRHDILFHLGDLTLNCTEEQLNGFIDRLNCRTIYCLYGNHVSPSNYIYKQELAKLNLAPDQEVYPLRYKNLVFCPNYMEIVVNGQFIVLCHYPLMSWNKKSHNSLALVGHEHSQIKEINKDSKNNKILDVGWDGFKKPLSFQEIMYIMSQKQNVGAGHH